MKIFIFIFFFYLNNFFFKKKYFFLKKKIKKSIFTFINKKNLNFFSNFLFKKIFLNKKFFLIKIIKTKIKDDFFCKKYKNLIFIKDCFYKIKTIIVKNIFKNKNKNWWL